MSVEEDVETIKAVITDLTEVIEEIQKSVFDLSESLSQMKGEKGCCAHESNDV